MTCSPEEQAQRERFEAAYLKSQTPVMLRIERSVCGCDFGGSSWTTEAEVRQIAKRLGLRPGLRLLDLGAGAGWPGLYLSEITGCDLVLADLPFAGIRIAKERAAKESVSDRVRGAVADAAALPFADASFDAINHSDLLCCLRDKRSVLADCRRAIRQEGRMTFSVVSIAPDLSEDQYRRALSAGPEFIETERDYPGLLVETGWTLVEREDATASYAEACRRQLDADREHEDDLVALIGRQAFEERAADWRADLAALGEGLLRHELFLATPALRASQP